MANGTPQEMAALARAESPIALYAPRAEIREAMDRFKAGLAIKDATEHEYAALAHVSVAHGLDPFNGEAWIIAGHGVTVGIKGLRKLANRQAKSLGFRWWIEFHDVRSPEECRQFNIPDDCQAAIICHLRRSDHIEAYAESLKALKEIGNLSYEMIIELLGKPPLVVGIGYVKKGEVSKMPLPQLVRKRAEAHALKQVFDVPFVSEGDELNGRVVDESWVESKAPAQQLAEHTEVVDGQVVFPDTDESADSSAPAVDQPAFVFESTRACSSLDKEETLDFVKRGARALKLTIEAFRDHYKTRLGVEHFRDTELTIEEAWYLIALPDEEWSQINGDAA